MIGENAMNDIEKEIREQLFALQDVSYKSFQCKLMPTVDPATVIGVRTPTLRLLAKKYAGTLDAKAFMAILPHRYYEENNLHGMLIDSMREFDAVLDALEAFLPHIDNWATCDLFSPKVFKQNLPALYEKILSWIESNNTYTVRFAIGMMLQFFLDDAFQPEMLHRVAKVKSNEYYIRMMIAWYFATALAKQEEAALVVIRQKRLEKWTHNKAIQKAIESRRVGGETKALLRTLRI
jgi:3-methyladenine DNA glycosylase AlkD